MEQMPTKEEHYSVRWTSHSNNLIQMFTEHRLQERLADVTIICEGQLIKAHKIILSSCSAYFNDLFKTTICGMTDSIVHPIFVLVGEKFSYLNQVIQFIYQGEIKVPESDLEGVLALGEKFQIKGLCSVRVKHKPVPNSKPPSSVPIPSSKSNILSPPIDITKSDHNPIPESLTADAQSPRIKNIHSVKSPTPDNMPYSHKLPILPASSQPVPAVPVNRSNNLSGSVISASPNAAMTMSANVSSRAFGASPGNAREEEVPLTDQPLSKKLRMEHAAMIRSVTPTKSDVNHSQQVVKVITSKTSNEDSTDKLKDISTVGNEKSNIQSSLEIDDNKKKHSKSLSPFMIFASEWRKKLAVEHPGESNKEISVRLGNLWKNLSSETKQTYYSAAMKGQWKQDVTNIRPSSNAATKTIKKRRMTIDASLNWRTSTDEDNNAHIIDLDSDSSTGQQKDV